MDELARGWCLRFGAKELQGMARAQMRRLPQFGVSPEVAGTRWRHELPMVFGAMRVSSKC